MELKKLNTLSAQTQIKTLVEILSQTAWFQLLSQSLSQSLAQTALRQVVLPQDMMLQSLELFFVFMSGIGPDVKVSAAQQLFSCDEMTKYFIPTSDSDELLDRVTRRLLTSEPINVLLMVPFQSEYATAEQFWCRDFPHYYTALSKNCESFKSLWHVINEHIRQTMDSNEVLHSVLCRDLYRFDILLGWRLSQLWCGYQKDVIEYINDCVSLRQIKKNKVLERFNLAFDTLCCVGSALGSVNPSAKPVTTLAPGSAIEWNVDDENAPPEQVPLLETIISINETGDVLSFIDNSLSLAVRTSLNELVMNDKITILVDQPPLNNHKWMYVCSDTATIRTCGRPIVGNAKVFAKIDEKVVYTARREVVGRVSPRILIDAALEILSTQCNVDNEVGIVGQIHLLTRKLILSRNNVSANCPFILLLGASRSGKSIFCNRFVGCDVTGCTNKKLTSECAPYFCSLLNCYVIDTPGFNALGRENRETLSIIMSSNIVKTATHVFILLHRSTINQQYISKYVDIARKVLGPTFSQPITVVDTHHIPKKEAELDYLRSHSMHYLSQNLFFANFAYLRKTYHALTIEDVDSILSLQPVLRGLAEGVTEEVTEGVTEGVSLGVSYGETAKETVGSIRVTPLASDGREDLIVGRLSTIWKTISIQWLYNVVSSVVLLFLLASYLESYLK